MNIQTPTALIVFKRLAPVQEVFKTLRLVRPAKLYIIADGWRNEEEEKKCRGVREYLESAVDWPCEVYKNYSDTNLGCRARVVSGLNWVFEHEERAIILEDDCVPEQTFFQFCEELLERYKDAPHVMQISGLNTQYKNPTYTTNGASYYFSRFGEIWGWATWRRAWKLYDEKLDAWPRAKNENLLSKTLEDPEVVDYWEHMFDQVHAAQGDRKKFDAWAAQWVFTQLLHDGLSAVPKTNLITNLGDDIEATRFREGDRTDEFRRPITSLSFPLIHPTSITINANADTFTLRHGFKIKATLREKILFFLKQHMPRTHKTLKQLFKRQQKIITTAQ